MKKNGFTLIELLAVIVILAIIAIIATPIVLNIINNAKTSSNERSGELYIKAVENAIMKKQMSGTDTIEAGTYTVQSDGSICIEENNVCSDGTTITIDVDGELPEVGSTLTISEKGVVTAYTLTVSGTSIVKVSSSDDDNENEESTIPYSFTLNDLLEHNIIYKLNILSKGVVTDKYIFGFNLEEFVIYIGFNSLNEFNTSNYSILKYVSDSDLRFLLNSEDDEYYVMEEPDVENEYRIQVTQLDSNEYSGLKNDTNTIFDFLIYASKEGIEDVYYIYSLYTYEEFLNEYGDTVFYLEDLTPYFES